LTSQGFCGAEQKDHIEAGTWIYFCIAQIAGSHGVRTREEPLAFCGIERDTQNSVIKRKEFVCIILNKNQCRKL
jgi:hypothetical protein